MSSINSMSWFKKYQPKVIEDYVFENEDCKQKVKDWIENGAIDGNLILYGPGGTGKSALSYLLIHGVIKNKYDLMKVKDKGVKTFDDELPPWLLKAPQGSKQKIVYIEEFDRCSPQALNSLKDGLMDNYQPHVAYIATTNYFNKLEDPIKQRFTHQFNLSKINVEGAIIRLTNILQLENIQFHEEGLRNYVEKNKNIGLRKLINGLQTNVKSNCIDFNNVILQKSEFEDIIVEHMLNIFNFLMQCNNAKTKIPCLYTPTNSGIATYYNTILENIVYNSEINYQNILEELFLKIYFMPCRKVISEYMNTIDYVKIPHIHFNAFIGSFIKACIEMYL